MPSSAYAATADNLVPHFVNASQGKNEIWWPCLVFNNYTEMQQSLSNYSENDDFSRRQIATDFLEYIGGDDRKARSANKTPVAYLIGRNLPRPIRTLYRPEQLLEFFTQQGKLMEKYSSDQEWMKAVGEAAQIALNGTVSDGNSNVEPEKSQAIKSRNKSPKKTKPVPKGKKTTSKNNTMKAAVNAKQASNKAKTSSKSRNDKNEKASKAKKRVESTKRQGALSRGVAKNNAAEKATKKRKISNTKAGPSVDSSILTKKRAIPKAENVWTQILLPKKFKTLRGGKFYCLPNVDPRDENVLLGRDYFDSLTGLQKYLCAYGLEDKEYTSETDRTTLQCWIRNAIVPFLRNKVTYPDDCEEIKYSKAWTLMAKLGFKYSAAGYRMPGVRKFKKDEIADPSLVLNMGVNTFEIFDREDGLWVHLARFGLPTNCKFHEITETECLQLELFLSTCPEVNTFTKYEYKDTDPSWTNNGPNRTHKTTSMKSDSATGSYMPILGQPQSTRASPDEFYRKKQTQPSLDSKILESDTGSISATIITRSTNGGQGEHLSDRYTLTDTASTVAEESHFDYHGNDCDASTLATLPIVNDQSGSMSESNEISLKQHSKVVDTKSSTRKDVVLLTRPTKVVADRESPTAIIVTEPTREDDFLTEPSRILVHKESPSKYLMTQPSKEGNDILMSDSDMSEEEEVAACTPQAQTPTDASIFDNVKSADKYEDEAWKVVNKYPTPQSDDSPTGQNIFNHLSKPLFGAMNGSPADSAALALQFTLSSPPKKSEGISTLQEDDAFVKMNDNDLSQNSVVVDIKDVVTGDESGIVKMSDDDFSQDGSTEDMEMGGSKIREARLFMNEMDDNTAESDSEGYFLTQAPHASQDSDAPVDANFPKPHVMGAHRGGHTNEDEELSQDDGQVSNPDQERHAEEKEEKVRSTSNATEALLVDKQGNKMRRSTRTHTSQDINVLDTFPLLNECNVVTSPERKKTVGKKLKSCVQALDIAYRVEDLAALSDTEQSSNEWSPFTTRINEIDCFLQSVIESSAVARCRDTAPASLYICGAPGTGKTSAVKYCCDQIVEQSKQKMPPFKNGKSKKMSRDVPTFCFINGAHIQSMKMVIMDIAKHLGIEQKNPQTCNIEKILKTGRESSSNRFLVVVIDEIDLLLSSKKSSGAGNSGEKILSVLLNWASSESFSFGLIGISNAVGNHYAHRLSNLGPISKTITFSPYRKEDLVNIVERRIGRSIVDPKAVMFAASKVSAIGGDARKVLELTASAVNKCYESQTKQQKASSSPDGPIVKMLHMMQANRATMPKHAATIAGLPQMAKIILCVALSLSQAGPAWKMISLGRLKTFCTEASSHNLFDDELNIETFLTIVEQLVDAGLLLTGTRGPIEGFNGHSMAEIQSLPVRLGMQLQDVESALEQTLGDQKFYRDMISYVKETDLHNVFTH